MTEPVDAGPWRGPTLEQWLRRVSHWPTPWIERPTTSDPALECDDCFRTDGTHDPEVEH